MTQGYEVAVLMVRKDVRQWPSGRCMMREPLLEWIGDRFGKEDARYERSRWCGGELFGVERVPDGEFVMDVCRVHTEQFGFVYSPFRTDLDVWLEERWGIGGGVLLVRQLNDARRAIFGGTAVMSRFDEVVEHVESFAVWLRQWGGRDAESVTAVLYQVEDAVGARLDRLFEKDGEATWRQ